MVDKVSGPIIREDEGIDTKLASVGVKTSDLDYVFISHMDFDHTSGLRLVKDAKRIQTSEEEWKACNHFGIRYIDTWTGICDVQTFSYHKTGIDPFGRSFDVFGDGSVQLISTPGYSKGLFSVRVMQNGKYIILGNDAAYTQKSFEEHIIPGFIVDKSAAKKSLDWLCQCRKDLDCLEVLVNHDPLITEHVIEL